MGTGGAGSGHKLGAITRSCPSCGKGRKRRQQSHSLAQRVGSRTGRADEDEQKVTAARAYYGWCEHRKLTVGSSFGREGAEEWGFARALYLTSSHLSLAICPLVTRSGTT